MDTQQMNDLATAYLDGESVWVEEKIDNKYYLRLVKKQDLFLMGVSQIEYTVLDSVEEVARRNLRSEHSVKDILDRIAQIKLNRDALARTRGVYHGLQLS